MFRSGVAPDDEARVNGLVHAAGRRVGSPGVVGSSMAGQTGGVDLRAELDAACTPEVLFAQVAELDSYPGWLTIVSRTVFDMGVRHDGDETAWLVDLRGRVGPIARSKRLRMVRTVHEPHRRVRFERRELDGRNHAPWVLEASIEPAGSASRLTVDLHYGGTFGGALLRRMLEEEIERSRPRLAELAVIAQQQADAGDAVDPASVPPASEQRP
jgi:hypothetical protein